MLDLLTVAPKFTRPASHAAARCILLLRHETDRQTACAVADPGFLQGGAAAGAFGVPQAPSCPLSLRPLRKFRGS